MPARYLASLDGFSPKYTGPGDSVYPAGATGCIACLTAVTKSCAMAPMPAEAEPTKSDMATRMESDRPRESRRRRRMGSIVRQVCKITKDFNRFSFGLQ